MRAALKNYLNRSSRAPHVSALCETWDYPNVGY